MNSVHDSIIFRLISKGLRGRLEVAYKQKESITSARLSLHVKRPEYELPGATLTATELLALSAR